MTTQSHDLTKKNRSQNRKGWAIAKQIKRRKRVQQMRRQQASEDAQGLGWSP